MAAHQRTVYCESNRGDQTRAGPKKPSICERLCFWHTPTQKKEDDKERGWSEDYPKTEKQPKGGLEASSRRENQYGRNADDQPSDN